jgi:hypothetical protein
MQLPETSVDFHQGTRRHNTEDRTLNKHCCEDMKSYHLETIFVDTALKNVYAITTGVTKLLCTSAAALVTTRNQN